MPYTPKTDRSHSQGLLRSTDSSFFRNPEASQITFPQLMLKQSSTARGKFLSTLRSTKSYAGLSESNLANLTHTTLNHTKDLNTLIPKGQTKISKKSLEQTDRSVILKNLDLSNTNFESFNGFADETLVNQTNFEDPLIFLEHLKKSNLTQDFRDQKKVTKRWKGIKNLN
jgi:hypothetical protein